MLDHSSLRQLTRLVPARLSPGCTAVMHVWRRRREGRELGLRTRWCASSSTWAKVFIVSRIRCRRASQERLVVVSARSRCVVRIRIRKGVPSVDMLWRSKVGVLHRVLVILGCVVPWWWGRIVGIHMCVCALLFAKERRKRERERERKKRETTNAKVSYSFLSEQTSEAFPPARS